MGAQKKEAGKSVWKVVPCGCFAASLGNHRQCHSRGVLCKLMQGLDLFHFRVRLMAAGANIFWESDIWICSSSWGLGKGEEDDK